MRSPRGPRRRQAPCAAALPLIPHRMPFPRHTWPAPSRTGAARRILFVNQYYWPDHASTAQHLTDLAESLADQGFECHVLASQGRYKPGEPRPPAHETHQGVQIHRVPATSLGRRGTWSRMTDYLSFYAGAWLRPLTLAPIRRGRHLDHAADHRARRHDLEASAAVTPHLLEHGSPSRRQHGARANVAAEPTLAV